MPFQAIYPIWPYRPCLFPSVSSEETFFNEPECTVMNIFTNINRQDTGFVQGSKKPGWC